MPLDRRVKQLLFVAALMAVIAIASYWYAEPNPMSQAEVMGALAGKTVEGERDGVHYQQYFDAAGWTDYIEHGDEGPIRGAWRATEDGQVCTRWPDLAGALGNQVCYGVWVEGDVIVWLTAATGRGYPGRILLGNRLRW